MNWFNDVDATYRSDLRELNDLNYARSRAELGQFAADIRREMQSGFSRLEVTIAESESRMIKWAFAFSATSLTAMLTAFLLTH